MLDKDISRVSGAFGIKMGMKVIISILIFWVICVPSNHAKKTQGGFCIVGTVQNAFGYPPVACAA
jgi:hypothetical protein